MQHVGRRVELTSQRRRLRRWRDLSGSGDHGDRQMGFGGPQLHRAVVGRGDSDFGAAHPQQRSGGHDEQRHKRQPVGYGLDTQVDFDSDQRRQREGRWPPPPRNPQSLAISHAVRRDARTGHAVKGSLWPRVDQSGLEVKVVRLDPELPLPNRAHDGDAGVDLYSAEDVRLDAGQRALVRTGVAVAIPFGMVGLVHPRSGLAARVGLSIVNSPGTIDAGYRGEIKVALINLDPAEPILVHRGDRIAQLLVQRVELVELVEVASFDEAGLAETSRGDGGHGSSGGHASL